jgi:hypothetical protein
MPKKQTKNEDELSASQQAEPNPSDTVKNTAQGEDGKEMPAQTATWADVATNFERLRKCANGGDLDAQAALVKYLNARPDLWDRLGETALHAETALVEAITDGDWLTTQAAQATGGRTEA